MKSMKKILIALLAIVMSLSCVLAAMPVFAEDVAEGDNDDAIVEDGGDDAIVDEGNGEENGEETEEPDETAPTGKFETFEKLDYFVAAHAEKDCIEAAGDDTMCELGFGEDGTMTVTGTWGAGTAGKLAPGLTVYYKDIMSKTKGFGEWKSNDLPNTTGEYKTIVFKVKTSDTMLGGTTKLSFTVGAGDYAVVASAFPTVQGTSADGYQYIVFDLANEDLGNAFKTGANGEEKGGNGRKACLDYFTLTWLDGQFINQKVLEIPAEDRTMTFYSIEISKTPASEIISALNITAAPVADLAVAEPPAETVATTETTAPETTAAETTAAAGGCGSVIGAGAAAVVLAAAAAAVALKKKEN